MEALLAANTAALTSFDLTVVQVVSFLVGSFCSMAFVISFGSPN